MGIFNRNKKGKDTSTDSIKTVRSEAPMTETVDNAESISAEFFSSARTPAYINHNFRADFIEWRAAIKVSDENDGLWRVMHYELHNFNGENVGFKSHSPLKGDVSFSSAMQQLSAYEGYAKSMPSHEETDLFSQAAFQSDKFRFLRPHFLDIEHYLTVSHIEGLVFDKTGNPHRRVEGKVINGEKIVYTAEALSAPDRELENFENNPHIVPKIEKGILSDIFFTATQKAATLDGLLKVGRTLSVMDDYATSIGAFYLGVQKIVGIEEKFEKVDGLSFTEKKDVYARSEAVLKGYAAGGLTGFDVLLNEVLPQAKKHLETARGEGVFVEPFQNFVAECEMYTHLLSASRQVDTLRNNLLQPGKGDTSAIARIEADVQRAEDRFLTLGGTQQQTDKLKAWVAKKDKDSIPPWVSGFLSRYYTSRARVVAAVKDKKTDSALEARVMPAHVKPPAL